MANQDKFKQEIAKAYRFKSESFMLGGAILDGESLRDTQVKIPLRTLNRHGLIAGATGTGKTKTLQTIAECLSEK